MLELAKQLRVEKEREESLAHQKQEQKNQVKTVWIPAQIRQLYCLCLKKLTGAPWPVIESVIVSWTFWWLRLCFVSGVALPGRAETAEMSDPAQRLAAGSRRWKAREWVAILKDTCPRITQEFKHGSWVRFPVHILFYPYYFFKPLVTHILFCDLFAPFTHLSRNYS